MAENLIYVTKEGLLKLQEELQFLKNNKRVEIAEKLKEAISFGDLSENSEYEDARNEQAQVEKRIIDLEEQLKTVVLVDESKNENKVKIGSLVTILDLEKNEVESYKIVGTTESDILSSPAKISNESPIGKSIIGKKKGDKVKVKTLGGVIELKIEEIN
ncbi:transcription elongation factor GreA [Candidatus Gracilibacteria bacterium]|nr:transcription elongation factor GreA [Candidatus Gracilibacteria bacterium]